MELLKPCNKETTLRCQRSPQGRTTCGMLCDAGAGMAAGLQSVCLPLPSCLTGGPKGLCRTLRAGTLNYHLRGLLNLTAAYLRSQGSAGLVVGLCSVAQRSGSDG